MGGSSWRHSQMAGDQGRHRLQLLAHRTGAGVVVALISAALRTRRLGNAVRPLQWGHANHWDDAARALGQLRGRLVREGC